MPRERTKEEKYDLVVSSGEESNDDEEGGVEGEELLAKKDVKYGAHQKETEKSRLELAGRQKMWTTVGSSDEEDNGGGSESAAQGGAGGGGISSSSRSRKKRRQEREADSGSEDSGSTGSSSDESDEPSSKRAKKEKKDKKDKKKKAKKEKKRRKEKKKKDKKKKEKKAKKKKGGSSSSSSSGSSSGEEDYMVEKKAKLGAVNQDEYGKYGIIQMADKFAKQREFEAWLTEVKKAPAAVNGAQWEVAEYFKEFMEDFNTATLPHAKFYNYEKWEQLDYDRKQQLEAKKSKRTRTKFDDDEALKEARKATVAEKAKKRLDEVRTLMNRDKISDMKHQSLLRAEMQNAYKTGDTAKVKKLEMRLNPEIEDAKWGKYNAPDLNLKPGV